MSEDITINLKNVHKSFGDTEVIKGIDLYVRKGEFLTLLGPSGCGKTTLLRMIGGFEKPTHGDILLNGEVINNVPPHKRPVNTIFQKYALFPHMNVAENIAFALEVVNTPRTEVRKRVREVLKLVDLSEKSNAYPLELSGGQQQRVAIARAIANKPMLLIADEPTGNLDPDKSNEIISLLEKINEEEKSTILMVTHDTDIVNKHKKRTIALDSGHVVADITTGGYMNHE